MLFDHRGNIWISQYGNGIAQCDSADAAHGNFTFHFSNQTAGEDFNRLIMDGNGFLWALSDRKIIQINPLNSSIKNFTSMFGLLPGENFENIYSANDNRLVVTSGMKYFSFDPASILLNRTPPPVVINSFKIFEAPSKQDVCTSCPQACMIPLLIDL